MLKSRTFPAVHRPGFTLIELLVVIAIIAVLIGLLLPAVQKVREAANRMSCQNNLKQIGLAAANYEVTSKGLIPARITREHLSWAVVLLPYLEQETFYGKWDTKRRYSDTFHNGIRELQMKFYYCPSRRSPPNLSTAQAPDFPGDVPQDSWPSATHRPGALADYAGCAGDDPTRAGGIDTPGYSGALSNGAVIVARWTPYDSGGSVRVIESWSPRLRAEHLRDGASNTILIGEKHVQEGKFGLLQKILPYPDGEQGPSDGSIYSGEYPWVITRVAGPRKPLAKSILEPVNMQFGSSHSGVVQFVFCDGSVHTISVNVDPETLGRLANRKDGQVVGEY